MTNGYNTPIGVPIGLPSILSLGLPPLVNPYPTLNLDFIENPQFDSRITFSRGSQATLFDSTGTLVYAKQNLLLQSQALTTSPWITTSLSAVGSKIAPDGTATAIAITATGTNGRTRQPVTVVAGQTYTHSMFVRRVTGSGNVTLAILDSGGTALFSTVLSLTSEWQRFTVSGAPAVTSILAGIIIATSTDAIEVWGAQLNLANMEGGVTSSLTTYYPTTTAAYYAPRFDYNPSTLQPRGLLIEEQRTNSIRNNTMQGAVAGTPGTLPTNWQALGAGIGTLTQQIVGTGTSAGITYIDIRLNGTTSTTSYGFGFDVFTQIAALVGQTWTSTFYVARVGGSTTNLLNIYNRIVDRDSGGANLGSSIIDFLPTISTTLTRIPITRTLAVAGTAAVSNDVLFVFSSGVAIDITLRIGLPQLEQGAFATSVIPTTTTALTRNADVASMTGTNFSSWFNNAEGTLFSESQQAQNRTAGFPVPVGLSDVSGGVNCIEHIWNNSTSTLSGNVVVSSSVQANIGASGLSRTAIQKFAFSYKANDFAACVGGGAVATDTSGTIPVVDRLVLGARPSSSLILNGWIQRISYYPVRLPNSTLQALTA